MFRRFIGLKHSCKTLFSYAIVKDYSIIRTMSGLNSTAGIPLTQVVDALQKFAGLPLAASWDNVGLLIEPTEAKLIAHILLTNDLTEDVMQEALDLKTDMIITYHPLIFTPIKSITTKSWKVTNKFVTIFLLDLYLTIMFL